MYYSTGNMGNKLLILAIILVGFGIQSAFACSEEDVQHWVNVLAEPFEVTIEHSTQPIIRGPFTIPISSEIFEFEDMYFKVAERLNELGYFVVDGSGVRPVEVTDLLITQDAILGPYSTICNDPFMLVGGIMMQPDTATLLLAYGIANSVWMAPLAIGIGVGVYLTKSKWRR